VHHQQDIPVSLSRLLKPFMRYHGNNICPDEHENEHGRRTAWKHT